MEKRKSGLATAGLVLGIIGICTCFIPIINNISFILGILALIFGLIALIKKASKGKAIAALILGILSVVITLSMQAALSNAIDDTFEEIDSEMSDITGENTDSILANNLDVTIGDFQVIEGEYLTETKLVVTLNNKSEESKSFSVQIEAVDSDGKRINTDYVYADNLGSGQSQDFEAFLFVSEDEIEALKSATFNVVEVSMY